MALLEPLGRRVGAGRWSGSAWSSAGCCGWSRPTGRWSTRCWPRPRRLVDDDPEVQAFARTATEIGSFYPGDPGVLAALLMNRITLRPNEALYLPAGNLHAYLSGGGVEIMANSDNVMRGGLTPKHIDVTELLRVVDFTPGFGGLLEPRRGGSRGLALPRPGAGVRPLAAGARRRDVAGARRRGAAGSCWSPRAR